MFQRIFTAAGIQGIAVCQKGQAAGFLYKVCQRMDVLGSQGCQIAQFPKMHLNGRILSFKINFLFHTRTTTQALELFRQAKSHRNTKIRHITLAFVMLFSLFLTVLKKKALHKRRAMSALIILP